MKKDGVTSAFELIIEEIEFVASDLSEQNTAAFRQKNYGEVQQLVESGKDLDEFRNKVVNLLDEWQNGIDMATRKRFVNSGRSIPTLTTQSKPNVLRSLHTKSPKTRLSVTFSDGETIEEYYAADTFALCLLKLGLDRVEGLKIVERNTPLICNSKSKTYNQRFINGKYILTHSETEQKKEMLEFVARKLGASLKAHIVNS